MEFDLEEIKALIAALEGSGLSKLKLRRGEAEIELERRLEPIAVSMPLPPMEHAPARHAAPSHAAPPTVAPVEEIGKFVTSPIVGSFYRAPSPEADPFVEVGASVEPDTVVCLVEAMKVMNEVKAGVRGVIKEVLVENGHPVEFGSKLFRIG